jgi:hypothetical protein
VTDHWTEAGALREGSLEEGVSQRDQKKGQELMPPHKHTEATSEV